MRETYPFTGHFGNTHAVIPTPEWGGGGAGQEDNISCNDRNNAYEKSSVNVQKLLISPISYFDIAIYGDLREARLTALGTSNCQKTIMTITCIRTCHRKIKRQIDFLQTTLTDMI